MNVWQAVIVGVVLAGLLTACLWMARRPRLRVSAMPDEAEAPLMWPLSDGDDASSGPYLRGGSHAAALSGRR